MQVLPTIPKKDQRSRVKPKQDVLYRVGVVEGGGVIPTAGHQRNWIGIWEVKGGSPNFTKITWASSCRENPGFSGRGSATSWCLSPQGSVTTRWRQR